MIARPPNTVKHAVSTRLYSVAPEPTILRSRLCEARRAISHATVRRKDTARTGCPVSPPKLSPADPGPKRSNCAASTAQATTTTSETATLVKYRTTHGACRLRSVVHAERRRSPGALSPRPPCGSANDQCDTFNPPSRTTKPTDHWAG